MLLIVILYFTHLLGEICEYDKFDRTLFPSTKDAKMNKNAHRTTTTPKNFGCMKFESENLFRFSCFTSPGSHSSFSYLISFNEDIFKHLAYQLAKLHTCVYYVRLKHIRVQFTSRIDIVYIYSWVENITSESDKIRMGYQSISFSNDVSCVIFNGLHSGHTYLSVLFS